MLFLFLTACAAPKDDVHPPDAPPPVPSSEAPRPEAPAPAETQPAAVEKPRPEITIDAITPGNPLVVSGLARTFENTVQVRVLDKDGTPIAAEHTTSAGEMGNHNPYRAELWLVREVDAVTVEAFEYSAMDGSIRSRVAREEQLALPSFEQSLVWPAGDCDRFVTLRRRMPKSAGVARLLVEALVAGPDASERAAGATPPFPARSEVKSVVVREGVLTVDLSERLQHVGGACAATAIRESVTRTLQALPAVKRVEITAGGSAALALQP